MAQWVGTRTIENWSFFLSPTARFSIGTSQSTRSKNQSGGSNGERREVNSHTTHVLFESANGFTGPG